MIRGLIGNLDDSSLSVGPQSAFLHPLRVVAPLLLACGSRVSSGRECGSGSGSGRSNCGHGHGSGRNVRGCAARSGSRTTSGSRTRRSLSDVGNSRAGHLVVQSGVINVNEDARVGILVSTWEGSHRRDVLRSVGIAVLPARNGHLNAIRVELGPILRLTVLKSDDFMTEEVVPIVKIGRNRHGKRRTVVHFCLNPIGRGEA